MVGSSVGSSTLVDCTGRHNPSSGRGELVVRAVVAVGMFAFLALVIWQMWPLNFSTATFQGRGSLLIRCIVAVLVGSVLWAVAVRAAPAPTAIEVSVESVVQVYPSGRRWTVPITDGGFRLRLVKPIGQSRFQAAFLLHPWLTLSPEQAENLAVAMRACGVRVSRESRTALKNEAVTFEK